MLRNNSIAAAMLALLGLATPAQELLQTISGTGVVGLGYALAAGHVDNDQVLDFVATSIGGAAGYTIVIDGSTLQPMISFASRGTSSPVLMRWPAPALGYSVAIGDVDGDGFGDVLIGDPGAHGVWAGDIWVYSGRDGSSLAAPGLSPPAPGFNPTGLMYGTVGYNSMLTFDANGDQHADVVVSALVPANGQVYVFDGGPTRALLASFGGLAFNDRYGNSLAVLDDMNGDGVAELCIGSPRTQIPLQAGYVQVVSCGPTHHGQVLYTFDGNFPGDSFGYHMAAVADRSGDGLKDILVTAPSRYAPSGSPSAMVIASVPPASGGLGYSGPPTVIMTVTGTQVAPRIGEGLALCGDLDGDSIEEFVTGTTIYSGAAGSVLYEIDPQHFLGRSASIGVSETTGAYLLLGDYNADGVPELAVRENSALGEIHVISLAATTRTMGSGCGNPHFGLGFTSVPSVLGDGVLRISLGGGFPGGVALVFFGFSAANVPLPQFGAGCAVLLDTPMLGGAAGLGGPMGGLTGASMFPYALPAGPAAAAFHGLRVHAQAVCTDGQGLKFSNRGEFRIGL